MTIADMILNLLYNADAAAREYPEALSGDLAFDLRKLISLIEENKADADYQSHSEAEYEASAAEVDAEQKRERLAHMLHRN